VSEANGDRFGLKPLPRGSANTAIAVRSFALLANTTLSNLEIQLKPPIKKSDIPALLTQNARPANITQRLQKVMSLAEKNYRDQAIEEICTSAMEKISSKHGNPTNITKEMLDEFMQEVAVNFIKFENRRVRKEGVNPTDAAL